MIKRQKCHYHSLIPHWFNHFIICKQFLSHILNAVCYQCLLFQKNYWMSSKWLRIALGQAFICLICAENSRNFHNHQKTTIKSRKQHHQLFALNWKCLILLWTLTINQVDSEVTSAHFQHNQSAWIDQKRNSDWQSNMKFRQTSLCFASTTRLNHSNNPSIQ